MGERKMISEREAANEKAKTEHLEGCKVSDFAHMVELEEKRRRDALYIDTKFSDFWERKRKNTQKLRDKTQQ
jgi:hypothetical protein